MKWKYAIGMWVGGLACGLALPGTALGKSWHVASMSATQVLGVAFLGLALCQWGRDGAKK